MEEESLRKREEVRSSEDGAWLACSGKPAGKTSQENVADTEEAGRD